MNNVSTQSLANALSAMVEAFDDLPDANCSCHLSPPCNDCVEYGAQREAISNARQLLDEHEKGDA